MPSAPARATSRPTARRRRGSVLIYSGAVLVAFSAFASLAVDYGRVQLAKTELQSSADLAARYAATGVRHEINGVNAAPAMARAVLAENRVDARYVRAAQSSVEVGVWTPATSRFTPTASATLANAVRVTVSSADADAIPTIWGKLIGFDHASLTATATALYDADRYLASGGAPADPRAGYLQKYVPATSNIWLAGSAPGKTASNNNPRKKNDKAASGSDPGQSPVAMSNLRVSPGATLSFDGVNGGANNSDAVERYNGDGNTGQIVSNYTGAELGKSDLTAPINCVIAVFLDDAEPSGATPPNLSFSTAASRDFQTLRPKLKQVFFIGDGRRANGDMQHFVVPPGATRLFVGTMDAYEWNNNVGGFAVTATASAKVVIVK